MRMSFVRFVAFLMALILCLSVVATALAYNTIPYGEESQDVRDMQSKLKSKGYYKGKWTASSVLKRGAPCVSSRRPSASR